MTVGSEIHLWGLGLSSEATSAPMNDRLNDVPAELDIVDKADGIASPIQAAARAAYLIQRFFCKC